MLTIRFLTQAFVLYRIGWTLILGLQRVLTLLPYHLSNLRKWSIILKATLLQDLVIGNILALLRNWTFNRSQYASVYLLFALVLVKFLCLFIYERKEKLNKILLVCWFCPHFDQVNLFQYYCMLFVCYISFRD